MRSSGRSRGRWWRRRISTRMVVLQRGFDGEDGRDGGGSATQNLRRCWRLRFDTRSFESAAELRATMAMRQRETRGDAARAEQQTPRPRGARLGLGRRDSVTRTPKKAAAALPCRAGTPDRRRKRSDKRAGLSAPEDRAAGGGGERRPLGQLLLGRAERERSWAETGWQRERNWRGSVGPKSC